MSNNDISKKPLKYLEIPLNNFKENAIPHHLKLLNERKLAIQEIQNDPSKLKGEEVIIKRTMVQLKDLMYNLETLRTQVQSSDLDKFDDKTVPLLKSMTQIDREYKALLTTVKNLHPQQPIINEIPHASTSDLNETKQLIINADIQQMKLKEREACLENVERIQSDIEDLHGMYGELNQIVNQQGEAVNQVEGNVEAAQDNINMGNQHLMRASRIKASVYPVAGALMGGAVGGPLGFLAGLKIGGLAALTCGCIGFIGGTMLKKHKLQDTMEPTCPEDSDNPDSQQSSHSDNKDNKKHE